MPSMIAHTSSSAFNPMNVRTFASAICFTAITCREWGAELACFVYPG